MNSPVFGRCDADLMVIIDSAAGEARRSGHDWLGTEHLLLSFAQHRGGLPQAAAGLLPGQDAVRSALAGVLEEPRRRDVELLEAVGVDLAEVRSAVRQTFGDEAVEQLGRRRVHQPWQPWRRPSRRCTSLLAGTIGVAPRVKQALERAGEDADRRGLAAIGPPSLLLGMIEVDGALSNRLLRDLGIDPEHLGRALRGRDR